MSIACPHCQAEATQRSEISQSAYECPHFGCPGHQGFDLSSLQADVAQLSEWLKQGRQATKAGDAAQALQHFNLAFQTLKATEYRNPQQALQWAEIHFQQGLNLFRLQQSAEALKRFDQAVSQYQQLYQTHQVHEQGPLAVVYFYRAQSLQAQAEAGSALKDLQSCLQIFEAAAQAQVHPSPLIMAQAYLEQARLLQAQQRNFEGLLSAQKSVHLLQALDKADSLENYSLLARAHVLRGSLYQRVNDSPSALQDYGESIHFFELEIQHKPEHKSELAQVLLQRAGCLMEQKQWDLAHHDAQAANRYHAGLADALLTALAHVHKPSQNGPI